MALRNQPYLPLYVQDFLTDEKLNECSANAHGVYIKLMCLMHKSEVYGTILLKQNGVDETNLLKQNDINENDLLKQFAVKLLRHFPFTLEEILNGLTELVFRGVIDIQKDRITQKRMVKDNYLSEVRALSGSKGGKTTQFALAKNQANTESEIEYEDEDENVIEDEKKKINGESFEKFWNLYDKKVGDKKKLIVKWGKLKETDRQKIFETLPLYIKSTPDKQFRKHPATYFNQKSWNDEIILQTNGTVKTKSQLLKDELDAFMGETK